MMITFNNVFQLDPDCICSDKSLTHRAFILASIADGVSHIDNVTFSQDVMSTVEGLRTLGATIDVERDRATVTPIVALPKGEVTIDCGNSGTTARLLAGLAVGLGVKARFIGDESLSKRPMNSLTSCLSAMGAQISQQSGCLFVCRGGKLVGRNFHNVAWSAQLKSAVILAGLFADGVTAYSEKTMSRNHTELMLSHLGASVQIGGDRANYMVSVQKSRPRCFDIDLPRDPSAVAYSVALALLTKQRYVARNVLISPTRIGFYDTLINSGADIAFTNVREAFGEQIGDIEVGPSRLTDIAQTELQAYNGIDEIPILATVAVATRGVHRLRMLKELKTKECDRCEAIKYLAEICAKECRWDNDTLIVRSDGVLPKNVYFNSFGDHRIAMCEAVLSLVVGGGSVNNAPFAVSNPCFLQMLGVRHMRFGLIGVDVSQSVSPRMMAYLALNSGVCCSYELVNLPADVSDADLIKTIEQFDGLNVTMPFKTRVAKLLHADVASVNTVGKNIAPQSTDGYGLVHPLEKHKIDFANKPLWIVGAGGASEACVTELLKYGCKMQIVNRTAEHARRLQTKYGLSQNVSHPVGVLTFVPECEFEKNILLPDSCKFVFISAYRGASGVREQAEKRNLKVVDGLEMNYSQGTKGFSLWTGTKLQDDYAGYLKFIETYDYL